MQKIFKSRNTKQTTMFTREEEALEKCQRSYNYAIGSYITSMMNFLLNLQLKQLFSNRNADCFCKT